MVRGDRHRGAGQSYAGPRPAQNTAPLPVLTAIATTNLNVGDQGVFAMQSVGFTPQSVVEWNGSPQGHGRVRW